ncbi:hypothetical protein B0H13DRAFT_2344972 [Mycena leptocephala]|nr:hypothetical protein B0H13DRAFT_2344972 [Mycena leptocephala]
MRIFDVHDSVGCASSSFAFNPGSEGFRGFRGTAGASPAELSDAANTRAGTCAGGAGVDAESDTVNDDSDDADPGEATDLDDDVDMADVTAPNRSQDGEDFEEEAEDVLGEYLKTKAFGEADIQAMKRPTKASATADIQLMYTTEDVKDPYTGKIVGFQPAERISNGTDGTVYLRTLALILSTESCYNKDYCERRWGDNWVGLSGGLGPLLVDELSGAELHDSLAKMEVSGMTEECRLLTIQDTPSVKSRLRKKEELVDTAVEDLIRQW